MKVQKSVWLLMYYTSAGMWQPSLDHTFPWSTRRAARRKKAVLGERGKMYRIMRFDLANSGGEAQ